MAFYPPPDVSDPGICAKGETPWLEATVTDQGMPRPMRMGVQRESPVPLTEPAAGQTPGALVGFRPEGTITPLPLR